MKFSIATAVLALGLASAEEGGLRSDTDRKLDEFNEGFTSFISTGPTIMPTQPATVGAISSNTLCKVKSEDPLTFYPPETFDDLSYTQLGEKLKEGYFQINEDAGPPINDYLFLKDGKCVTEKPVPTGTGDPHFYQFNSHKFDFHGACDLVLLENPGFNNGQGLTIHIRTKITRWWSSIDSAVVKIGDDSLEVKAGFEERQFWYNGKQQDKKMVHQSGPMRFTLGGFKIRFRVRKDDQWQFKIFLNDDQYILVRNIKDLLRVELDNPLKKDFEGSLGLVGKFDKDKSANIMFARDGVSLIEDPIEYGKEWQVRISEPMLFHNVEGVQHPQTCEMPTQEQVARRRLAHSDITREAAVKACAFAHPEELEDCVNDVMTMNDLEYAGAF